MHPRHCSTPAAKLFGGISYELVVICEGRFIGGVMHCSLVGLCGCVYPIRCRLESWKEIRKKFRGQEDNDA